MTAHPLRLALFAGLLACTLPATAAASTELRITLRPDPSFIRDVNSNCAQFYVNRRRPREGATTRGRDTGTLDVAGRRGELRAPNAEWQIGQIVRPAPGRPFPAWTRLRELGVRLDGTRAHLTAEVARPGRARGTRQDLGEVRGLRFETGLMNDELGRIVRSSYRTRIEGRFVLGPVMSRIIERTPCRRARRAVRPGRFVGTMRLEHRPQRATGLEGRARIRVEAESRFADVTVEPAPGSTPTDDGGSSVPGTYLSVPITSGLPVPLVCILGRVCAPNGGTYALGGGFVLVRDGARAAVTGLTVRSSGTSVRDRYEAVTGVIDGTTYTIRDQLVDEANPDGPRSGEAFARRLSDILRTDVALQLEIEALFDRTGPPAP